MKARFNIIYNDETYILIEDQCEIYNSMSITNDAEGVVEYLIKDSIVDVSNKKIFYVDTEGRVDELEHNGQKFIGFKPGYKNLNTFFAHYRDEI